MMSMRRWMSEEGCMADAGSGRPGQEAEAGYAQQWRLAAFRQAFRQPKGA
jgi:hypothetical protein